MAPRPVADRREKPYRSQRSLRIPLQGYQGRQRDNTLYKNVCFWETDLTKTVVFVKFIL